MTAPDPRVTGADVVAVMDTDLAAADVVWALQPAANLVEAWLGSAALDAHLLVSIETYVAAHLVALRDPSVTRENVAGALSTTFEAPRVAAGLAGTRYGQTAITLDTTGALARSADTRRKAVMRVTSERGHPGTDRETW